MTSAVSADVTEDGALSAVQDGYEAVYDALPHGETFNRLWRKNAYRGEFPVEFAHIGFLTPAEAERLLSLLAVPPRGSLVDVARGGGGPGLWAARETGRRSSASIPLPPVARRPCGRAHRGDGRARCRGRAL
jgi:hypothetical protein